MNPLLATELNILEQNVQTLESRNVFALLIRGIKANKVCRTQLADFQLSRQVPVKGVYDVNRSSLFAKDVIDCYSSITNDESAVCKTAFNKASDCVKDYHGNNYEFPQKCLESMEDYLNC